MVMVKAGDLPTCNTKAKQSKNFNIFIHNTVYGPDKEDGPPT